MCKVFDIYYKQWLRTRKRTISYLECATDEMVELDLKDQYSFKEQILHILNWEIEMFQRVKGINDPLTIPSLENPINRMQLVDIIHSVTNRTRDRLLFLQDDFLDIEIPIDGAPTPFFEVLLDLLDHEAHHRGQIIYIFKLFNRALPNYEI
ncbi:DinB family protein [Hazenella sp. IB182357]|uniref:DinB family protein n=1 Tax=Polycladospora coralii TaxID=2771432 RepID=A0A926NIL3_9BACL|nr:DinB family protein [Polycladospora coralii]MBD1373938.1 DinB family protein [Polycladospora coralii]MBS7531869.1 DinB family protein [Polycladospora coralii]